MHSQRTLMYVLDFALMLSVIGLGCAAFMLCVGFWNVYTARAGASLDQAEERARFLRALRRVYLSRVTPFNEKRFPPKMLADLDKRLTMAGNPGEIAPAEIIGLQQLAFGGFTMFGLLLVSSVDLPAYLMPIFFALGWFFPMIWLNDQVKKRHHAIQRALPYNLDLLTLAVEAGLDFSQAVGKVVEKGRPGPMVEEFRLMLKNLRVGKTREEALRIMSDRVNLPALSSFTSALIQADRMGTSLGKILRIQSTQLRLDRSQRAEKLANEAPVKMLFPLIACIFPTVFMVLFGPIIYQALYGGQ